MELEKGDDVWGSWMMSISLALRTSEGFILPERCICGTSLWRTLDKLTGNEICQVGFSWTQIDGGERVTALESNTSEEYKTKMK